MTREAFIRKWLANKDFQYCEDGRAQMREDLDKVIEHAQPPTIASVIGKRLLSIEWQAKEAIERLTTLTHEVDELKSACASGAVDKTVSGYTVKKCMGCGEELDLDYTESWCNNCI